MACCARKTSGFMHYLGQIISDRKSCHCLPSSSVLTEWTDHSLLADIEVTTNMNVRDGQSAYHYFSQLFCQTLRFNHPVDDRE